MRRLAIDEQHCPGVRTARLGVARAEAGFSLPELMLAMAITLVLMTVVFAVMRQNQDIFVTETGVTSMNENIRAAVDLLTREVQAAGTGLRGFEAPILGVDSSGETGDRLAIVIGDPYAPIARVRPNTPGTDGVTSVAIFQPVGTTLSGGRPSYRDLEGKVHLLYKPDDLYVLYRGSHFVIVRVAACSPVTEGVMVVHFAVDDSNPRARFGSYQYVHATDAGEAQFARLDGIVYYAFDREKQTLERRENHEPWADVARGITGFQVRYRVEAEGGALSEPLDEPPAERAEIRSVVVTVRARTPDVDPASRQYRETAERVEIAPRNMRLPHGRGPEQE